MLPPTADMPPIPGAGQDLPLPTDIPAKPLSVLCGTRRSFSSSLESPFQQDGSGPGSNSWGYMSRQCVNKYYTRSLDMVLAFALQKFLGSCGSHCLAQDLVKD